MALPIKALFLDIGGVLLSNGWDGPARKLAVEKFDLDAEEFEARHHLNFETYEAGKLTLDQYLNRVVFYRKRRFTPEQFQEFMLAQSTPFPKMIRMARELKTRHKLKVFVVNNEGRELNKHRIHKYKLDQFVDCFVSSCCVQLRKPDEDIFRVALELSQVPAKQVVYIDDRLLFVQVARTLGMRGVHHEEYDATRGELAALGLKS